MKKLIAIILKTLLSFRISSFIFCLILRICMRKKHAGLLRKKICIYSSCFGGYDEFIAPCKQSIPCDNLFFTDKGVEPAPDNVSVIVSSTIYGDPRHDAKYYKLCPHLIPELEDYDITIWIDSSGSIHSHYFLEMLLMCTSGPVSMRSHPDRSSILSESLYSQQMLKYSSFDLLSQAESYILKGIIDDHLWHCAMIIRNKSDSSSKFNDVWWREMAFSLQDQISAPFAEFVTGVAITPIPKFMNLFGTMSYNTSHRNHEYRSG